MPELEDQMATFTGGSGERTPDRLDSLVWALTPYLKKSFAPPGRHGVRGWAAQAELDEITAPRAPGRRKRLAGVHGGAYDDQSDDWGLDGFAPQETRATASRYGRGATSRPGGERGTGKSTNAAETGIVVQFPDLGKSDKRALIGSEIGTQFDFGQRLFAYYGQGDVSIMASGHRGI